MIEKKPMIAATDQVLTLIRSHTTYIEARNEPQYLREDLYAASKSSTI